VNVQRNTREAHDRASAMKITPLSEHIGAEVTGIDLRNPVDDETRRRLNEAVVEHIVMVIRDQDLTPAQFLAAASLFGEAETGTAQKRVVPELPVFQLSSRDIDKLGVRKRTGAFWHTDATQKVCPPNFTTLYPVELPASGGGGTAIANMRAGYNVLPDEMKQRIDSMKTVNRLVGSVPAKKPDIYGGTQDQADLQKTMTPAIHPLVRIHPVNKSKVLYFNPIKVENIIGMTPEESHDLLDELLEMAVRPEFIYEHNWRMGDMLIWDNRSAMHKAGHRKEGHVYDPNDHRTLNRITLKGGPTL
jgi:alpha-ketoglutarate-dependent taurine dioxygenase